MNEDYVNFKTAKLLKEKGFLQEYDIYHSMVYNEDDYEHEYEVQRMVLETKLVKAGTLSSYPVGVPEPKCFCPSLSMAMKWLRKVHKIIISIAPTQEMDCKHLSYVATIQRIRDKYELKFEEELYETSYESATKSAIKYCLTNLI